MLQRIVDAIRNTKVLLIVPVALLALGFVIYPSGGSAQEDPETDVVDQQALTAFEECQELRDNVFPEIDGLLAEIVDSGIVDQEKADGFYGFISDIADTGCVAQAVAQPEDALGTIADLTGTSEEEVIVGIKEHGSLAAFAEAHGVTEEELIDAVMGNAEANASALVETGEVDQASADRALALIEKLVTKGVNVSLDGDFQMPGEGWDLPDHDGWKMPGQ